MGIKLNEHDQKLVDDVKNTIKNAYELADMPSAVAKSISSCSMKFRNKGRKQAMNRHPSKGICEASGLPLKDEDKVLDEIEPEKGYKGQVRWVCPKANNSGKRTCGGC